MKETINRVGGIDLIKSVAIFFVISHHFFLNNGYYYEVMQGTEMFIATFLRWIFYTCVPLFLLTTGYLMRKKELNKKYYKSLSKIVIAYLIISIITLIVRMYYFQDGLTWTKGIIEIFRFNTNGYSWYVNMYIGLFLLIPFLNVLYNNLRTPKEKQVLIISLILLTSVSRLFPNWWNSIFPLTFYFIGAYINEYSIKIKKSLVLSLAFLFLLAETVIAYFFPIFLWLGSWGALPTVVVATCLFLVLYDIKIKSGISNLILTTISKLTLEIYLISYIIDKLVYPHLKEYFSNSKEMLPYYVIIVPFIFIVSVLIAIIVNFVQRKVFIRKHQ